MTTLKTHYDNLQVARTASPEVIAAAYRTLSLRYHPDRNGGDPRSERIMRIVNHSYAVLSDPEKRRAHDEWIRAKEKTAEEPSSRRYEDMRAAFATAAQASAARAPATTFNVAAHLRRFGLLYLMIVIIGAASLIPKKDPAPSGLPSYDATASALQTGSDTAGDGSGWTYGEAATQVPSVATAGDNQKQLRPAENSSADIASSAAPPSFDTAPNGHNWPDRAGYVEGYERLRTGGLSSVTIDNSSNSNAFFVKLVAIEATSTHPVRQVYLPAHGSFTMKSVAPGAYDVRYQDLSDGSLSRSEQFELTEIRESDGTRYSNISMTLFRVNNGNMQTFPLSPSEF